MTLASIAVSLREKAVLRAAKGLCLSACRAYRVTRWCDALNVS